jgi:RNA polymerase sigma factor (sigma-70 family)
VPAISANDLAQNYYSYVLTSARILTHFSEELAQDLTQETFLRALRALPGRDTEISTPGGWLTTILGNLYIDHLRHQQIVYQHSVVLAEEIWECIPDDNVEEQEQREEEELLSQVLAMLPPKQREILLLRARGMPFRKLRAHLHVHISTAKRYAAEAEQRFIEIAHELIEV